MDIRIQPELDFSAPDDRAHPQTALVPVATLDERRVAGALDAIFLAITGAGFLALFRSLGGEIAFEKVDAAVYLDGAVSFLRAVFFSLYYLRGRDARNAVEGPDDRATGWQPSGHEAAAVAKFRLPSFGRDADARVSMGAVGRGSVHVAGPHFAYVHYCGQSSRAGQLV